MAKSRAFGLNFISGEIGLKVLYKPGNIPGPVDATIQQGLVNTLQIKYYCPTDRTLNGFSGKYFQLNLDVAPNISIEVARIALESGTDFAYVDAFLYLSNIQTFALNKNQQLTCQILGDTNPYLEQPEQLCVYGFALEPE
jgi:hypothetical protein